MVLNDLVADILDQVERAVPREKVDVGIKAAGLLEIDAPERVLAIIFTNLLRNAMTYTEAGRVRCVYRPHRRVDQGHRLRHERIRPGAHVRTLRIAAMIAATKATAWAWPSSAGCATDSAGTCTPTANWAPAPKSASEFPKATFKRFAGRET